jgi:6-phosphofructokinase 1
VKETVTAYGYCMVVVGEGIKNKAGEEIGADKNQIDAFGHPVLAGAAEILREYIQGKLNTKTRTVLLGYAQRSAAHLASLTDAENAFACGEAAVRAAISGKSGYMVKIVRNTLPNGSVQWSTDLHPLAEVANVEHFVPREWISEDGYMPNEKFLEYATPLIEGEVRPPMNGGLPVFAKLARVKVDKTLSARS